MAGQVFIEVLYSLYIVVSHPAFTPTTSAQAESFCVPHHSLLDNFIATKSIKPRRIPRPDQEALPIMSSDSEPHFKFYHYDPSLAGACVFAVLFGVATIWHAILITKHRTLYFIPLLIGGICTSSSPFQQQHQIHLQPHQY